MYNQKRVILQIIQALRKYKTRVIINFLTKKDIDILIFLWQNNFIYGFSKKTLSVSQQSTSTSIYLKYNKTGNILINSFLNKNVKYVNFLKQQKWVKNTFFIIDTKKGFLNSKSIFMNKIGGFLLTKFF